MMYKVVITNRLSTMETSGKLTAKEAFELYCKLKQGFAASPLKNECVVLIRSANGRKKAVEPLDLFLDNGKIKLYEVSTARSDDPCEISNILIKGRRKPTKEEAKSFLKEDMYGMGYDEVCSVDETSPSFAIEAYDVKGFADWPIFG